VLGRLVGVRLTEFNELVTLRFGATYGASVLADHVLTGFDGRSGAQAIEDGVDPRMCGGRCASTSTSPASSGEVWRRLLNFLYGYFVHERYSMMCNRMRRLA
jgi:hypothetical protein